MYLATVKFLYVLGVFTLLGSVTLRASADSSESNEMDSAEERGRCYCNRRSCTGLTGSSVVGCPNTNSFLQCNNAACAVQACTTGQVWNKAKKACSACDAGKHVSSDLQVCVCNQGTTLDSRTQSCVACPTGSTQEADRCYCPSATALDVTNKACKACPVEAPIRNGKCMCTNTTLFFNQNTWTCNRCPGSWIQTGGGRSGCRCTKANQIFYRSNVTCYTCPTGTTADRDNDDCECARNTGLKFDYTTESCACKPGYTLSASGICTISTLNP